MFTKLIVNDDAGSFFRNKLHSCFCKIGFYLVEWYHECGHSVAVGGYLVLLINKFQTLIGEVG